MSFLKYWDLLDTPVESESWSKLKAALLFTSSVKTEREHKISDL